MAGLNPTRHTGPTKNGPGDRPGLSSWILRSDDSDDPASIGGEGDDLDDVARLRSVHDLAPARVDAHMPEPRGEDQVARLHGALIDLATGAPGPLRPGGARQRDAGGAPGGLGEPRAVPARGPGATEPVRLAHLREGEAEHGRPAARGGPGVLDAGAVGIADLVGPQLLQQLLLLPDELQDLVLLDQ